jgi:NAD(P)H-hydrate epimerase
MREIDRKAIEECGVPSLDLMERAGGGAAQVVASIGVEKDKPVVILCGKGNNGGDGFVAARYLKDWGAAVTCWMIGERDEMTSDALRNLVAAEETGVAIRSFRPGESETDLAEELGGAQYAIDALLGTGAKGQLRDPIRRLTRILNESGARTFALDVPTGMDADSGETDPDCVRALMTITFGFPKRGLYALPGRQVCGDITVIDLAYPEESVDVSTGVLLWQEMRHLLPAREPRGHKGTFGRVAVIAGSRGMAGAACLAAEAALRSGAGLVKLLVPEAIADLCAVKLTEVMVFGMPGTEAGTLSPASLDAIAPFLGEADSVLLGPGLGSGDPVRDLVATLVPRISKPAVVDADGLNALAAADGTVRRRLSRIPAILTPHPGELARLVDGDAGQIARDSVNAARNAARGFGCEVILKGAPSVVASPDGNADLCSLGNDGMATAGSGDVLAGLLAGILAQGATAGATARLGAMVHSRAGDICQGEIGARGMIAGDILRCLPYAWRELEGIEEQPRLRLRYSPEDDDDDEGSEEADS